MAMTAERTLRSSHRMFFYCLIGCPQGSANLQLPVLSILHCMLYYVDLNAPAAQPVNADLLRAVAKFIDVTVRALYIDWLVTNFSREQHCQSVGQVSRFFN